VAALAIEVQNMTETTPLFNPYVGPRTFQEEEADRFFGREREARELVALVVSERLTLFYAQSGAGKSSLINTRLIPRLRDQESFTVLPVGRVSGVLPEGVNPKDVDNIFVYHLILGLSQKLAEKEVAPSTGREQGPPDLTHTCLARFLSGETGPDTAPDAALAATAGAEGLVPHVLIIDQFEELLTTYPDRWQERAGFFDQLSKAMARHPNLWIVLTLREDYIAALEPYSHLAPNRLRARFYMQRMGIESAREAVEQPAANANRPFAGGVAGMLVDNLRMVRTAGQTEYHAGEYVEPVQLQVVCFQLWEDLRSKEAATIELTDLERLAGGGSLAEYVDGALSDFYEKAIARVLATPELGVTEPALRSWFSDKLITKAGTRSIVFRNENAGETDGLPNRAVTLLGDQFLLRTELRAGGAWVELVHDRFIEPIREANQAWFARNLNPLIIAAEAWHDAGKPMAKLYTGSQLAAAAAELQAKPGEFGDLERAFVEEGQRYEARVKEQRQRRQTLILGGVAAAFALLAIVAALSAAIAGRARSSAETAASTAAIAGANAVTAQVAAVEQRATAEHNAELALTQKTEAQVARATAEAASTAAVEARDTAQAANTAQVKALNDLAANLQVSLQTSLTAQATMQPPSPASTATAETTPTGTPTSAAITSGTPTKAPMPQPTSTPLATSTMNPRPTPNRTVIAQQTQLSQVRATQTTLARSAKVRPTATSVPVVCTTQPTGEFETIWRKYIDRLGCPTQIKPIDYGNFAEQKFERGFMLWSQYPHDPSGTIVALAQGNNPTWFEPPGWSFVSGSSTCAPQFVPPANRYLPRNGFGGVWCDNAPIRKSLGWGVEEEHNAGAALQEFRNGYIFRTDDLSRAYVLFRDDRTYVVESTP
jgi:hypothetical protein